MQHLRHEEGRLVFLQEDSPQVGFREMHAFRSIETLCAPEDTYAACVYHTLKFDMNGEFL